MANAGKKKAMTRSRRANKKTALSSRPRSIKQRMPKIDPVLKEGSSHSKFICKVCSNSFETHDTLNEHLASLHRPRRAVTAADIVNRVFEGRMNFPKTKAEIVRFVEENDREAVTPEVIDTVRNMPDKLYFTEADFVYGIEQTIR